MAVLLYLLAPTSFGFALLAAPQRFRQWMGFGGALVLAAATFAINYFAIDSSISIPFVLEARWSLYADGLMPAAAFALAAAPILLFVGTRGRLLQMMFFFFALGGAWGVIFSSTLMALFFSWEFVTITTSLLILADEQPHSHKIGLRFLFVHLLGGLSLLAGVLLQYSATESLAIGPPATGAVTALFTLAVGIKAVFLPVHFWLPFTYPQVTAGATIYLALLTTKVGIVGLVRLLPPMGLITYMGAIMAIYGAVMALVQSKTRPALSYLIISGVGFMVTAAGFGNYEAAYLHMFNHMLYKSLLLMGAFLVLGFSGSEDLKSQTKQPPWLVITAVCGAAAAIGLPPFNGFVSKALIKEAAYGTSVYTLLQAAALITVLAVGRYIYYSHLSAKAEPQGAAIVEAARVFAAGLLTVLVLLTGFAAPLAPGMAAQVYTWDSIWSALSLVLPGLLVLLLFGRWLDPAKLKGRFNAGINFRSAAWEKPKQLLYRLGQMEMEMTQLPNGQYVMVALITVMLTLMLVLAAT